MSQDKVTHREEEANEISFLDELKASLEKAEIACQELAQMKKIPDNLWHKRFCPPNRCPHSRC